MINNNEFSKLFPNGTRLPKVDAIRDTFKDKRDVLARGIFRLLRITSDDETKMICDSFIHIVKKTWIFLIRR